LDLDKNSHMVQVWSSSHALCPSHSQVSSLPSLPALSWISKWHLQPVASLNCPSCMVHLQHIRAGISVAFKTTETYRSQVENY